MLDYETAKENIEIKCAYTATYMNTYIIDLRIGPSRR